MNPDIQLDMLRVHLIRLANAGVSDIPPVCYRFGKFLSTADASVRTAALSRGAVPALVAALCEGRPRPVANALYALSQLARALPAAGIALQAAGALPYIARAVASPHSHVQFRALQALPRIADGCPENAAAFREYGVLTTVLQVLKSEESSWQARTRAARAIEAIASADPDSRKLLLDDGALEALARILHHAPERCMKGTAKDAIKALGLPWNILEGESSSEDDIVPAVTAKRAVTDAVDVDRLLGTSLAASASVSGSVAVAGTSTTPMGFSTFVVDSDSDSDTIEDIRDRNTAIFATRTDGGAGSDRNARKFEAAKRKWAAAQKRELAGQVAAVREMQGDLSVDDGFFSGAMEY